MLIVKIRFKSAGIAFALGSVANIAITIGCRVGYFLQKIGYFLHFRPFRAFFSGQMLKSAVCAENGMRCRVLRDAI